MRTCRRRTGQCARRKMASEQVSVTTAPAHKGGTGSAEIFTWGAVVCALGLATLTTAFAADFASVQADETMLAWAGKQVVLGRTPYREFFAFLPPLLMWGVGGFYSLAGATLGSLRLLSIGWLAGATVLLYVVVVRQGLSPRWAAAAALLLPALLVPFWPVSSHHWFALGFGLAALVLVSAERPGWGAWFGAGMLAALAGLCVQTSGVVFGVLLAGRLLVAADARSARHLVSLGAGIVLPLAFAVMLLRAQGALGDAFQLVVLWPLNFYKQPEGFNDLRDYSATETVSRITPGSAVVDPLMGVTMLLIALLAALLLRGFRAPAGVAGRAQWRRWAGALAGAVMTVGVCLTGRPDWTHLILAVPPLLYLSLSVVHWSQDAVARRSLQAVIGLALVLLVGRWTLHWTHEPPSLAAVVAVDQAFRNSSVPSVLGELPDGPHAAGPIVYLSHGGSGLYFYHAPEPPPVDWLLPASHHANSPMEFERMAHFMAARRVPYVLIPESYAQAFLADSSALRDILRTRYEPASRTSWGLLLRRSDERSLADGRRTQ